jgi:hypothetical protein
MANTARYLYGLIRTTEDLDFGEIGIPHNGRPGRVYSLRAGSVGAVVSALDPWQKVLPFRKNLEPHHRVLRAVMSLTTILPMTFGHVASEGEVARLLRHNHEAIGAQLDRVAGKVEMCLTVKWAVDNIFEYFVGFDAELRATRDRLFGPSGEPSQADKIELGRMFEDRRSAEREALTERITELFRAWYSDVTVIPPRAEAMIAKLAFLVERGGVEAFEQHVHEVADAIPGPYVFDLSGPWAPFHFVGLDLRSAA